MLSPDPVSRPVAQSAAESGERADGFIYGTLTIFGDLPCEGDALRSRLMSTHRIGLIGLSALALTATATMALAQQNPATTLQNGITFNPIPPPSTSSTLLP
jgi:hypothetical protein